jgi:hypothetical protein
MAYQIRTNVRRIVYTRPAALPRAAAGSATGFERGTLAYDRAPPVELATIVHYPDASGTRDSVTGRLDAQVVTVSRLVPTISRADVVKEYATEAAFVAAVLTPLGVGSLGALAPDPFVAGSPLRWQRAEYEAE